MCACLCVCARARACVCVRGRASSRPAGLAHPARVPAVTDVPPFSSGPDVLNVSISLESCTLSVSRAASSLYAHVHIVPDPAGAWEPSVDLFLILNSAQSQASGLSFHLTALNFFALFEPLMLLNFSFLAFLTSCCLSGFWAPVHPLTCGHS